MSDWIFAAGLAQFSILIASALVPFQLDWRKELAPLQRLHRQMYIVYGGYIVLSIIAFGTISVVFPDELASRSPLARAMCVYIACFWGIRLLLQPIFDVKPYLTKWWLRAGYHLLTVWFVFITTIFICAAW